MLICQCANKLRGVSQVISTLTYQYYSFLSGTEK